MIPETAINIITRQDLHTLLRALFLQNIYSDRGSIRLVLDSDSYYIIVTNTKVMVIAIGAPFLPWQYNSYY